MNSYFDQCCIILFLPKDFISSDDKLRIDIPLVKKVLELTTDFPSVKHIYTDVEIQGKESWKNNSFEEFIKTGKDEGEQMENAFRNAFDKSFRKVILIRSFIPLLTQAHFNEALLSLKIIEFCIGPDSNGSYYLIGMNQFEPVVFRNKDWNSNLLLKSTIRDMGTLKYALYKLPLLA